MQPQSFSNLNYTMNKFGIYMLVCFTNTIICVRAGMNSGEGVLQWLQRFQDFASAYYFW